jgi:hypothetical protein
LEIFIETKMVRPWQVRLLLLFALAYTLGFRFDQDTGENCTDRTRDCSTDKTTYFECPITCAKALEPESGDTTSSGPLDDEAFYDLQAKDANGNTINFEKFQGYVTVIAAIPLLQGKTDITHVREKERRGSIVCLMRCVVVVVVVVTIYI